MNIFWKTGFVFFIIFINIACAAKQGERIVLEKMIEGKTLLDQTDYIKSKESFLFAAAEINKVWNKADESKKVRQFWYEEGIKSFKGEPHERSMLFYYLGLLFLREGDYGNAQAAFSQSILQDAFAEEQKYRADFSVSYFLQALSLHYLGSQQLAEQNLQKFISLKQNFLEQEFKFGNSIFIIETGAAPQKITKGKRNEFLSYRRGSDRTKSIKIKINEKEITIAALEDIYWQAMSRGGRPIDAIVKNKVIFKNVTEVTSEISLGIAEGLLRFGDNRRDDELGVAFLVLGIGANALSEATKTSADTRHWSNLPNVVYLSNLNLAAGSYPVEITFFNDAGDSFYSIKDNLEIEEGSLNFFRWAVDN